MRLVQAFVCAGKTCESRFNHRGGVVKKVKAYLIARDDLERSFHHSGGPVRLVQACLCGERPGHALLSIEKEL